MMRGAAIGAGRVAGYGAVKVFADLDRTDRLHILDSHDGWHTVNRSAVTFTKKRKREQHDRENG